MGIRWLVILLALAAPVGAAEPERPPLTIASEGARPPFNYLDANNELAGFEIDLARELCARLRRSCVFKTQDWDGLIPGLLARDYDLAMAALDITDERRAKVAFSIPYARLGAAFVIRKDGSLATTDEAALAGKTIGVEDQSASQTLLEERYRSATAKAYASLEEAMLDLGESKIDGVLADRLAIADFLKTRREGQCCRVLGDAPRDPAIFGEGIGAAMRKDDAALREQVDAALQATIDDGTFARIAGGYFDFPIR